MLRILVLDRSNPVFVQWTEGFARSLEDLEVEIILVSDKERSRRSGNLEVINIRDIPQRFDADALERKLGFSLHRALVPERAFFDYSSFRSCQRYSNLDVDEIGAKVAPYINAFDYLVRERADVIIEGLADNFMTSVVGRIAGFYGKKFYMGYAYYWWSDGLLFIDRLDQTSSEVDRRYAHYRSHPEQVDRAAVDRIFSAKRTTWQFPGGGMYSLKMRLQQVIARGHSYEPISWKHWICRRVSTLISRLLIRRVLKDHRAPLDEDFLLFPLHVSPEATLLGSSPELADQFSLLKNISMNMPLGMRLYVKEHPAQPLGAGLDYGFYRRLTALPNVRYFRADASLNDLMMHPRCHGVVVINGTVGLEAAMKRRPVFVFGRALYGVADCFLKPNNFQEFFDQVQRVRQGNYQFDEQALYAILQALDQSVVRADMNVQQHKSWSDWVLSSFPIYRAFVERCLKETAPVPPLK